MSALTLPSCIITQPVQFEAPVTFPPSIETPASETPLDTIIVVDRDHLDLIPDFVVEVRDPDVDETLQYLVYVDYLAEAALIADEAGTLPPIDRAAGTDRTRRRLMFNPPPRIETPGCHRVELLISSDFRGQTREPVIAGDLGSAVWWVATPSSSGMTVGMESCP